MTQARLIKNHLVFPAKNPEPLRSIFPELRSASAGRGYHCAVPHTLDAARLLQNLGLEAPSPIRTQYDWPIRPPFKPYPHQVHTSEFLTLNRRAFVLSGMGVMKTLAALWAVDYLQRIGAIGKVVIACPLSCIEDVWGNEIFCNFPGKRFAVCYGDRRKRFKVLDSDQDIYIVNHDGLKILEEPLKERKDIDHFVIDEIATLRNQRTGRWRVADRILNKCGFFRSAWGLTGTPTPNEPTDAYAQMKLLTPENYAGSFTKFKHLSMRQITQFKWVPRSHINPPVYIKDTPCTSAEELVSRILRPSIRYALEDCVDLPETIHQDRQCELSQTQKIHYDEIVRDAVTSVEEAQITAVNAAVLIGKMIQIACGVAYDSTGKVVRMDFGPRLKLLKDIIAECDQKVIVFVPLTGVLNVLKKELEKHWSIEVVDGSVSSGKRNKIFRSFKDNPDPHILLANPGTMAHGLNLTAASMIIWYAPINNNDTYNQANARIVRPGQKNVTNIVHMYATSGEKKIYRALQEKTRLQDVILNLVKES